MSLPKRLLFSLCLLTTTVVANAQNLAKSSLSIVKSIIPIKFTLKEAGYVTLIVENKDGFRVRK